MKALRYLLVVLTIGLFSHAVLASEAATPQSHRAGVVSTMKAKVKAKSKHHIKHHCKHKKTPPAQPAQ
jgi:hypothetical protein